jgi:hypothetical protein
VQTRQIKPSIKYLLLAVIGLSVADALVSQALVSLGFGHEANPFLKRLSPIALVLLKVAGAVLAALLLWDVGRRKPKVGIVAAAIVALFLLAVLLWNVRVFFTAQVR